MNEWNRGTHVKPCMLSSGWGYPGERCSKGPCLKYLAIQTHSFDVHKILPSLLNLFRWSSSPRHGSSSVQDPSNIRKYSIYPSQWWGSQDRKTQGPGVVLEGCEGATVHPAISTRLWLHPSSSQRLISAWLLSHSVSQCSLSMATVSEPMAAAGCSHWLRDLELVLYPNTTHIH